MRVNRSFFNIAKERLIMLATAILFNVSLAAIVCGTFAWYTYAARTGLEKQYHGTTVGDTGSLQAGLVSDVKLDDFLDYDLAEDSRTLADEGKFIYWCKEKIEAETINYVVRKNGYATTILNPVTTSEFDYSTAGINDFTLYTRPTYRKNYDTHSLGFIAEKSAYSRLNFVFRFEDVDQIGEYLPNYDIFLYSCNLEATDEGREIYKAARFYFRNGYESYLINPTSLADGRTAVGGILDLNADGFYDYDGGGYEIVYGEAFGYNFKPEVTSEDGNIPWEETTTFTSNHKKDIHAIDEETLEPKYVNYISIDRFTSRAKAISKTDPNYHNLGRFDLFIYYEGWDTHLIDSEGGYGFNLDLAFGVSA